MPICKKCGKKFPNRLKINGQIKIINTRKYCLECSPFGLHNTRKPMNLKEGDITKCINCGREYIYQRKKGNRRIKCGYCMRKLRRIKIKKEVVELLGGKCSRCGYNRCMFALEFHHRNGKKDKEFSISGNSNLSLKRIKKEIEKCELLCANCHREEQYLKK